MNNSQIAFINLPQLSKNEKREIWMKRQQITMDTLAEVAGVKTPAISRNLRNDTMPVEQHKALVAYGLPAEILPVPMDQKRGPKPRKMMQAHA